MKMKSKQRGGNEVRADTVERCRGTALPQDCLGIKRMDLSGSRSTTCSATCQTVSIILWGVGGWAAQANSRLENERHDVVYRIAESGDEWGAAHTKGLTKLVSQNQPRQWLRSVRIITCTFKNSAWFSMMPLMASMTLLFTSSTVGKGEQ